MKPEFLIPDPQKFEALQTAFKKAGANSIHVLSAFNQTLIKMFVNGQKVLSMIWVLRNEGYLTPDYPKKANELFDYYHAFEIDPNLSLAEKKLAMQEWWTKHFQLLIDSGLAKKDIEKSVTSSYIQLRDGAEEFFQILNNYHIPLIIMSSSGLDGEGIELFLKHQDINLSNVHIISNNFIWDEYGKMLGIKKPIITSLNKDETILQDFPIYNEVKGRKNVILLGDSPHDVEMVTGFTYDNLLKIGFLNEKIEENLEEFKKSFDVIILNDGDLGYTNKTLKVILTK
jgi:cytosolic 5'-nucleotidase 3